MSNNSETTTSPDIIFDGWRSISLALFMGLVGYTVMVSVPVLSTAMVNNLGFSEVQVGRVWGNDLLGLSIGAIAAAFLMAKVNRQLLTLVGIILSIAGNGLCLIYSDYEMLMILRVVAGIGSGIFTAVAVATLGGTSRPVRAFNIFLLAFAASTYLSLHIIPKLTMDQIYLFFMGLPAICLLFIRWIPTRPLNKRELARQDALIEDVENWHVPKFLPLICLVAICFTYINIGGYYTYIELAALADGISAEWAGNVLEWSSIFGLIGCGFALVCQRFGLFRPLFVSLIAMASCVAMLSGGITDLNLIISMFAFMALWTFIDVYQSAMMAHMDRTGTLIAIMPSVQGFGQFIGPNIGADILEKELGYSMVFMVSGSMALVALVIYIGVSLYMHSRKPILTEAEAT